MRELFEEGHYIPVIDRQYDMEQIVEAYEYVETGQKTGNVVLKIADWS
ncbi:zinc-binding dehydrogenase [Belliella buryatensis]|nr:zinc-binding dehydrogenase [Belliella buryatensis]